MVALILINCTIMLVFHLRLRSRFSSARILKEIREEMDNLILDLGRETDRDVALLESRIKGLRTLIDEADRRVLLAGREEERRQRSGKLIGQLTEKVEPESPAAGTAHTDRATITPGTAVAAETERTDGVSRAAGKAVADGASGAAPEPVTIYTRPTVVRSEKRIQPVVPLKERVLEMARKDISPEMIASTLSMSLGEIELILDMNDSSL